MAGTNAVATFRGETYAAPAPHWHPRLRPGIRIDMSTCVLHLEEAEDARSGNWGWEDRAFEVLCDVFCDRDEAVTLVKRGGFPRAQIPDFRTPAVFWAKVFEGARNGALEGGVWSLISMAAKRYPANLELARILDDVSLTRKGRDRSEERHAPLPGSVAARLEAAYQHRKELTIVGGDTTEVNAAILRLRREQRDGPALKPYEFLGDGRFRLLEVAGCGGFATVWRAYDRKEGQDVAIKVLHGQFTQDAGRRERLFRGAKRMMLLEHPHVVRVLVPRGEEMGFHYYVMEYLSGGDLYQAITGKKITLHQALDMIDSVAGALGAAHEQGLVHRDVKPHNILLRENGTVALTDFDLVQAKDTTGGTRTGALGTVLYAAPEQNENASAVDHRADIYSLGMTAVFCVNRRRLTMAVMRQLDLFMNGLLCNEELRVVLVRAVASRPDDRFVDMAEFRQELAVARHARRSRSLAGELGGLKSRETNYLTFALRNSRLVRQLLMAVIATVGSLGSMAAMGGAVVTLDFFGDGKVSIGPSEGDTGGATGAEPRRSGGSVTGGGALVANGGVPLMPTGSGSSEDLGPSVGAAVESVSRDDSMEDLDVAGGNTVSIDNSIARVEGVATGRGRQAPTMPEPAEPARAEPSDLVSGTIRHKPSRIACRKKREKAMLAKNQRDWEGVFEATASLKCWGGSHRAERRMLRVEAHAESGNYVGCIKEGSISKDVRTKSRTHWCEEKMKSIYESDK